MFDKEYKRISLKENGESTWYDREWDMASLTYVFHKSKRTRYAMTTDLPHRLIIQAMGHLLNYTREQGMLDLIQWNKRDYSTRKCRFKYASAFELCMERKNHSAWYIHVIPAHHAIIIPFYKNPETTYCYRWNHAVICDNRMVIVSNLYDMETIYKTLKPGPDRLLTFKDVFEAMARRTPVITLNV